MAKTFDLKDDSVVVVIGSGAGGGTLSNELAQRGINVVCLEAGAGRAPPQRPRQKGQLSPPQAGRQAELPRRAWSGGGALGVGDPGGGGEGYWGGAAARS